MAETRTIKHGYFWYMVPELHVYDGQEQERYVERTAFQGETIEIPRPVDLERGETHGAFYTDAELEAMAEEAQPAATAETTEVALGDLDDEELVDWLMSTGEFDGQKKPNASEVVEAVGDDADLAERVIEAENKATGNQPRSSVVDALQKVADEE
jgi:hypothetical protein